MATLEDILKDTDDQEVKNAAQVLSDFLKSKHNAEISSLTENFTALIRSDKEIVTKLMGLGNILEKIKNRPDPIFPEPKDIVFPDTQRIAGEVSVKGAISVSKPDWYKEQNLDAVYEQWAEQLLIGLKPLFVSLQQAISNEATATRELIAEILNKETPIVPTHGAVRRANKWVVASTAKGNITGVIDDVNMDFYLPSAVIPNSETIRLNQGSPLSGGVDYSITGNKITFTLPPTAGSLMEVRYQT